MKKLDSVKNGNNNQFKKESKKVVLGITMGGRKEILGVWIGEHESSKFWLNVLNDLKSRGVLDVYLFCTDGLCGMMGGHPGGLSQEPFAALHRPSGPLLHPLCQLEGHQTGDG